MYLCFNRWPLLITAISVNGPVHHFTHRDNYCEISSWYLWQSDNLRQHGSAASTKDVKEKRIKIVIVNDNLTYGNLSYYCISQQRNHCGLVSGEHNLIEVIQETY